MHAPYLYGKPLILLHGYDLHDAAPLLSISIRSARGVDHQTEVVLRFRTDMVFMAVYRDVRLHHFGLGGPFPQPGIGPFPEGRALAEMAR